VTCDGGGTFVVRLEDVLEHPRAMRKLGQAVLSAERVWPTREELAGRVLSGDRWERACRDGVAATLREAVRNDFRDDRTVTVRGWVLSRTEADLYALAEIVQSSR
jgi:predicted alpha-1,6-mannanase (GH76 family)